MSYLYIESVYLFACDLQIPNIDGYGIFTCIFVYHVMVTKPSINVTMCYIINLT